MNSPEVEAALDRIAGDANAAFELGVTQRTIVWTAAAHANADDAHWPTQEGRALADRVARAFDPPSAVSAEPRPKQKADRRVRLGRVQLYIEPRDAWIGVYVDPKAVYVCPLPFIVFRWSTR